MPRASQHEGPRGLPLRAGISTRTLVICPDVRGLGLAVPRANRHEDSRGLPLRDGTDDASRKLGRGLW